MYRLQRHEGFTLIELLVVILIVGILAAIAIPAFLSQRLKAMDADAKTQARNVVSLMEACYTRDAGYIGCYAELQAPGSGLPFGAGPGQVAVTNEQPQGYEVVAVSRAQTAGVNHRYRISYNVGALKDHACTPAGEGGCSDTGEW